jgi:DNA-binding LacI/PurR family transcriptional regulator
MNSLRPSLKSIAEVAEVSINTVSDIINRSRHHLYDPRTVERVRQFAAKANYRPNRAAQALRSKKSRIIGFVSWNSRSDNVVANLVVFPFMAGASHFLITKGYHLAPVEMEEIGIRAGDSLPDALRDHVFDGLILQQRPWGQSDRWREVVGAPVLYWDTGVVEPTGCITRDERAIACQLTKELIQLGHQRIVYHWAAESWKTYTQAVKRFGRKSKDGSVEILPKAWLTHWTKEAVLPHFSFYERYAGYCQAMKEAGLDPRDLIGTAPEAISVGIRDQRATAIVVLGGKHIGRILRACFLAGLDVPKDISIASLDVDPRIQLLPDIDTGGMIYDRYEIGQQAAQLALRMVADQQPESIIFGSRFHHGETVAPAP